MTCKRLKNFDFAQNLKGMGPPSFPRRPMYIEEWVGSGHVAILPHVGAWRLLAKLMYFNGVSGGNELVNVCFVQRFMIYK